MALKNNLDNYIKLNITDNNSCDVVVYISEEERQKIKNNIDAKIILQKYTEILETYYNKLVDGLAKYNITEESNYTAEQLQECIQSHKELQQNKVAYDAWLEEGMLYTLDLLQKKGAKHLYSLMKEYFPEIESTIPNILYSYHLGQITANDTAGLYDAAKEFKLFGETEDC